MLVDGEDLDDQQIQALLEQLKVSMTSPRSGDVVPRVLRGGGPWGDEWKTFMELAVALFAPQVQEEEGA